MAPDEKTARLIRALLASRGDVSERRMFGGLAFMVAGHMLCAVGADHLMVRVGPEQYESSLRRPYASEMRFTGKPMRGYVTVDPPGYSTASTLRHWVDTALRFVTTLAPK